MLPTFPFCTEEGSVDGEVRPDDQHLLSAAELDEALDRALEKLSRLSDPAGRKDHADDQKLQVLCDPRAGPLRRACSVYQKIAVYFLLNEEAPDLARETALDVAEMIKAEGERYDAGWLKRGRLESFWVDARRHLRFGNDLFRLAPPEYRRDIIIGHFKEITARPPEPAVDAFKEAFRELSAEELSLVPDDLFLLAGGQEERERLPMARRVDLCRRDSDNLSLLQETARALGGSAASAETVRRFWDIALPRTEYGSLLFLAAPTGMKAEVLQAYLPDLPPERAAEVLAAELDRCAEQDKQTLALASPLAYRRRAEWAPCRRRLPLDQRVELCGEGCPSWLLEETAQAVAGSDSEAVFWDIAGPAIRYPSKLYDLAPLSLKLECLKTLLGTWQPDESLRILLREMSAYPSAEGQRRFVAVTGRLGIKV
jgi:hypothetical protein